jgi:signal transduction histidine kinase
MAHELRTPLAAISVQIESMAEGATAPTPERLEGCRDEIRRLTNLIAGLDRLEKAETRDMSVVRIVRDTDITALVRSVCAAWEVKAARENIGIDIEENHVGPVTAKIDSDAIAGAVSNLISNAVKYTPAGSSVRVGVGPFRPNIYRIVQEKDPDDEEKREDDERIGAGDNTKTPTLSIAISSEKRKSAIITVEDTGPGIPEDELPYIFERLYRADKSRNRDTGGAGIGLAIAKEAVISHGGSITAENAPGGGAVFTIVL